MLNAVKDFFVDFWDEEPELLLLFGFCLGLAGLYRYTRRGKRDD